MATGPGVNPGKTAFVKKYFTSNPDGNLETVNKAWTAEGNEGTVSESLVGKVREIGTDRQENAGRVKIGRGLRRLRSPRRLPRPRSKRRPRRLGHRRPH